MLTLGRTCKFILPLWYKGGGWTPLEFFICCSISKRFYLLRKPVDLLYKMRYILWVVALLGGCDVINNGRHLGFYQELEIRLKPQERVIFRGFTWKITYRWAFCMILATRFTFIVEGSLRNMYFHPKLAWPPVAYNVLTRYHSNLPSLNVSQNVHEGWINSYWKRQVQMFYPLGENSQKPPCTSEG